MSVSVVFKTVGHAFATFFKAASAELPKIVATKTVVEGVTAGVVGAVAPAEAPVALSIEDAGYAVLGEIAAVLNAGDAAAEQKLLNAGLDQNVVNLVKQLLADSSQVATLVKAATK